MLRRCKTILGTTILQVFTIKDITLEVNFIRPIIRIDVLVAIPGYRHTPDMAFDVEHFRYNKENDTYSCSANEILTTNGNGTTKPTANQSPR
jgi:hypothetical protein